MLNATNFEDIESIELIPKAVRRRLKNECRIMMPKCDSFKVEYILNGGKIFVTFYINKNSYLFDVSTDYPFTIPKLLINGLNHNDFFNLKSTRFRSLIKYVANIDCLCCNSYLCYNNWAPGVKFENIIDQIENYKNIKYLICLKIMLDQIKEKYLIQDINLDSWLFTPKYRQ